MKKNLVLNLCMLAIIASCSSNAPKTEEKTETNSAPVAAKKEFVLKSVDTGSEQVANVRIEKPVVATQEKAKPVFLDNQLALNEYKKGHFDLAESYINKAIKNQPGKSEFYNNLAMIHLAKNEQRLALQALRKGLQINPQDAAIAGQLGAIFVKEKDFIKAEIALEVPVQKGTQDASVLNNYAIALTANKKTDEAEKIYEKTLKMNPSSRDIMLNYSIFLIEQKQKYKQGLDLLNRLKFVGVQPEARNIIKDLENRAKAGLK